MHSSLVLLLKTHLESLFQLRASPFTFWITRRAGPEGPPLPDTRITLLRPAPIPPVIEDDNSTALDGFPLLFEDQYLPVYRPPLQLTLALPLDANVYGLDEIIASSGFRRNTKRITQLWARDEADPVDKYVRFISPYYGHCLINDQLWHSSSFS